MLICRKEKGFTLIELLISLPVLMVVLAISIPAAARWNHHFRAVALANSVLSDLQLARSESIRRGVPVVVCKRAGENCVQSGGWHQGWMVFADANNNAARDSGEEVIRVADPVPAGWKVLGNTPVRSYISFHPLGQTQLISGAFQAGTILICNASASKSVRRVIINSRGRPRVTDVEGEGQQC